MSAAVPRLTHADLRLERVGRRAATLVAARDFKVGELRLPPMVGSMQHVAVKKPVQATALAVEVPTGGGPGTTEVWLVPQVSLPSPPPMSRALARSGTIWQEHEWKPSNFAAPFWLVRRSDDSNVGNMELVDVAVTVVHTFGFAACPNSEEADVRFDTTKLVLPVMVNTAAVLSGTELVCFSTAESKTKAEPPKKKRKTWVDDATKGKTAHKCSSASCRG